MRYVSIQSRRSSNEIAAFEVAINNIDKLSIKVLGSTQHQPDLLEFDDFNSQGMLNAMIKVIGEPSKGMVSSSNRPGTLTNTPVRISLLAFANM